MIVPPIYADLFDDGITNFNFLIDNLTEEAFEKKLLDTIRFQVLIAILFERQIAIPECWMASSSLFLRVFREVDDNYPKVVNRRDAGGGVAVHATYPFKFIFFEDPHNNTAAHFLRMVSRRIASNRRILWLPGDADATGPATQEIREAVAGKIDEFLAKVDFSSVRDAEMFSDEFCDGLHEIFGHGTGHNFSALSVPLSRILRRLLNHYRLSPVGLR